jgi:hypothetical protein
MTTGWHSLELYKVIVAFLIGGFFKVSLSEIEVEFQFLKRKFFFEAMEQSQCSTLYDT